MSKMSRLAHDLEHMRDQDFVAKYKMTKDKARSQFQLNSGKVVSEGEVIRGPWPGSSAKKSPSFMIQQNQLFLGDYAIQLTNKEMSMIQALSNRGQMTKEQMLNHLYPYDQPELRIIDVFRMKINNKSKHANGGEELITANGMILRLNAKETLGEATEGLSGSDLVDHLTALCMTAWYGLTSKFKSKPDVYDIHRDAPDANGKYNVVKMTPGDDVIEQVYELITKSTNDLAKQLNASFGKTVFEPRIQRSEGNLETLVGFAGGKGGVLQCRATKTGGDSEVYLTMPVEAELDRAFSAMTEQPVPNDDGAAKLDDPDFEPVASEDPAPEAEEMPTDDFEDEMGGDLPDETPGFDEEPLEPSMSRRFENLTPRKQKQLIESLDRKIRVERDERTLRQLKYERKLLNQARTEAVAKLRESLNSLVRELKDHSKFSTRRLLAIHEDCHQLMKKTTDVPTVKMIKMRALSAEGVLESRGIFVEMDKTFKVTVADPSGEEETDVEVAADSDQDAIRKAKRTARGKVTAVQEPVEESFGNCQKKAEKSKRGKVMKQWEEAANAVGAGGVDMAPDAVGKKSMTRRKLPEFVTLQRRGMTGGPFG